MGLAKDRGYSNSRAWLYITTALLTPGAAAAGPAGGAVAGGSAAIAQSANTTTITQTTDRAILNWQSFDVNAGERVQFQQPSASSVTLNRVTGSASASQINGQITANGKLFLINPNGVVFGQGAQVNVGGLVASTANISDQNFLAGNDAFDQAGNPNASVENHGTITVSDAGLAALVAPTVKNSGTITANLGRVNLGAGDTFTLDLYGDGLINLQASADVQHLLVEHSGEIHANGGTVTISAAQASHTMDSLINLTGLVEARSVATQEGTVILSAPGANAEARGAAPEAARSTVLVAGQIDVSGAHAGEKGGRIDAVADRVGILTGAHLTASGDAGGGTIRIGGDYHGQGALATALSTLMQAGSVIEANATTSGDGGRVIVWADQNTTFAGTIEAMAGGDTGDGGFVETSGKAILSASRGRVYLTATGGSVGTWLLDPVNITIYDRTYVGADQDSTYTTADLETMSVGANVSLSATNDIALDFQGDTLNIATAARSLTLSATNQITTASTGTITTNAGAVSLTGTSGITFGHAFDISTSGAAISLTGATAVGAAVGLNAGSSTMTLANAVSGAGTLSLTNGSGTTNISGTLGGLTKAGAGTLTQNGALDINGNVTHNAGTFNQSTATLAIQGDLSIANGATFTKSSNSSALTFDGTGTLTDSNGTSQDLGAVTIGGTTTTRTLGSAVKLSSLTINSGNTFSLAGYNLTRNTSGAVSNSGTFRLQGAETLTNITNLGTGAGTVEYTGDGDGLADNYTIKDFGSTDYYNLTINATDGTTDTFTVANALTFGTGGAFTMTNGTYDFGSQTITIYGNWTYTAGTVNAGTSTVVFRGTNNSTRTITGSHSLYNVTFNNNNCCNNTSTWIINSGDTLTSLGTLTLTSGGYYNAFNTGTLAAKGDIIVADDHYYDGTATLLINGTGHQTFTGNGAGILPTVNINKESGTLTLAGTIGIRRDWTYTAGTIDPGTSTVVFSGTNNSTRTITGSHSLYNVTFSNGNCCAVSTWNINSGDTLTVLGTLTLSSVGQSSINSGTISAKGSINALSAYDTGTATLLINGTGDQTFTGNATVTAGQLPNININKASGTLALAGTIRTERSWTYTAGTIDAGTSTLVFRASGVPGTITGSHSLYNVTFTNRAPIYAIYNIASGTTLTTLGTLTFEGSGAGATLATGTLAAQGDVTMTGSMPYDGTTAFQFTGTNNQNFDLTGATNLLDLNTTINKASGKVTLLSDLTMNAAGQDLAITSGEFDLGGYNLSVTDQFTIGASGTLTLQGGETTNKNPTISAGGTVKYNGTGGSYTMKNWSYSNLTVAGGVSSVFTQPANLSGINNLTITSGIMAQGGYNLSATTLSNDGTLRLYGSETLTLTTMDTDSGTVEYTGDGDGLADSYTIKDFGANDYYHLTLASTDGLTDQFTIGSALKLHGNLTHTAGMLNIGANVTTVGGTITSSDDVAITANTVLDTTNSGAVGAAAITFNDVLNGGYDFTATGSTITLASAVGGTTPLDAVVLNATNSLTLPSVNATSLFARSTGAAADITLASGAAIATSGAGTNVTLVSGRNFVNSSGSSTPISTGAGRWLIYSTNPASDTLGGMTATFRRFTCAYGGSCPDFSGESGRGFLYSYTPTLTATPSALAAITYGDAVPNLVGYAYALTGYLASDSGADNVTGSLTGSTTYAQGSNVGSYNVNYSSGSLASALGYDFTYANSTTAITVGKKALTAVMQNISLDAGDLTPTLSATNASHVAFSGFYGADTATGLDSVTFDYGGATAGNADSAGTYTLSLSAFSDNNYDITLPAGVTTGLLTITAVAGGGSGGGAIDAAQSRWDLECRDTGAAPGAPACKPTPASTTEQVLKFDGM